MGTYRLLGGLSISRTRVLARCAHGCLWRGYTCCYEKGESWQDVAQTAAAATESLSDRWTALRGRTGLAGLTPATSAPGLTWSNAEREIFETKSAPLLNASITTCIGNRLAPAEPVGQPQICFVVCLCAAGLSCLCGRARRRGMLPTVPGYHPYTSCVLAGTPIGPCSLDRHAPWVDYAAASRARPIYSMRAAAT